MGRFYKTAVPEFVENYMYQPPWELAKQAMAVNEQGIQDSLNATNLLKNIDINYIPEAGQKAIVDRIQKKYTEAADNISKNIQLGLSQSPESWKKFSPEISNLGSTLQKDIKSGEIATITQSYNNHNKWLEDNKDIKEKDPLLYQAAYNTFMTRWMKNPNRSDVWQGEDLPDFDIHSKDIMDGLKEFEADIQTKVANGYITDTKFLSKDRIIQAYMGRVMSDPKAQAYLHKAIQYGVPGFVDENGKPNPFYKFINTKTGQEVSPERVAYDKSLWDNMTPAQRTDTGQVNFPYREKINESHPWMKAFNAYGEQREFSQTKVSADATYNSARERENARSIAIMRINAQRAMQERGFQHSLELAKVREEQKIRAEVAKLQDIIDTKGPNSKEGKEAQKRIDSIKKQKIKDGEEEYYHKLSFEEGVEALKNSKSTKASAKTIYDASLAKITSNKAFEEFKKKYAKNLTSGDISLLNYIRNTYNGKTVSEGIFRQGGLFGAKDETRQKIISWMKKSGFKEKNLYSNYEPNLAGASLFSKILGEKVDSKHLDRRVKLVNAFTKFSQEFFDNNTQHPRDLATATLTETGKNTLTQEYLEHSKEYTAIPLDINDGLKTTIYDVGKLLTEGAVVDSATPNGPLNQSGILKNKEGRKFLVINNNTMSNSRNKNAGLFNDINMFKSQEQFEEFRQASANDNATLTMDVLSELHSEDNFSNLEYDPKIKDSRGKPAAYVEAGCPTGEVNSAIVRFYPGLSKYVIYNSRYDKNGKIVKDFSGSIDIEPGETIKEFSNRAIGELQGALKVVREDSYKKKNK